MYVTESIEINASVTNVWNHLKTLQDAEKYLPVVTKSVVDGSGIGTTRTCDISMGEQQFQIKETLVKLDESSNSLAISIDDAPPPMKNMVINFSIHEKNNSSEITVNTESEQTPENVQMIKGILGMICSGLKQFHENK